MSALSWLAIWLGPRPSMHSLKMRFTTAADCRRSRFLKKFLSARKILLTFSRKKWYDMKYMCDIMYECRKRRALGRMYQVGEKIIYGSVGVCEILAIGPLEMQGVRRDVDYYTLSPAYQEAKFLCRWTPACISARC